MSHTAVIGSGFSGISSAAYLSAAGHRVVVYEKNETAGGRARQLKTDSGYIFDMGPSWYWMPDIFERFFNDFGYKVADFYDLKLIDPSFDMVFAEQQTMSIPADFSGLCHLFESVEKGSAIQLKKFMKEAKFKYEIGMKDLAYRPGLSLSEFASADFMKGALRLQVFSSFSRHVRKYFKHPKLIALMEFPILFLGAMPQDTPALYSLMNYAGLKLGTWYPQGGFGKVVQAMREVAEEEGAVFHFNAPVEEIIVDNHKARSIVVNGKEIACDGVVATADYHHIENQLLPASHRNYSKAYWKKRTFAPSCLIYYIGLNRKIESLGHHTLFFDESLSGHSKEIYKTPRWPSKPLFYVCCPSRTDPNVAPAGHEILFLLMPVASGLEDNDSLREKYFKIMINRLQQHIGKDVTTWIDFKESYCISDFISDYHSYMGNAYGLANTLRQTSLLKPKVTNKKITNLFYAGQLTVPGPGVPPALISGKIAAELLLKHLSSQNHEAVIR